MYKRFFMGVFLLCIVLCSCSKTDSTKNQTESTANPAVDATIQATTIQPASAPVNEVKKNAICELNETTWSTAFKSTYTNHQSLSSLRGEYNFKNIDVFITMSDPQNNSVVATRARSFLRNDPIFVLICPNNNPLFDDVLKANVLFSSVIHTPSGRITAFDEGSPDDGKNYNLIFLYEFKFDRYNSSSKLKDAVEPLYDLYFSTIFKDIKTDFINYWTSQDNEQLIVEFEYTKQVAVNGKNYNLRTDVKINYSR